MGILQSPVTLLIVGIVSFAIVHGQTSNSNQFTQIVVKSTKQYQFIQSSTSGQQSTEFENIAKKTCHLNGGAPAYDHAEKGLKNLTNCVMSVFPTEMSDGPKINGIDAVIDHYCPKVQHLDACVKQFRNSVNPCLDAKLRMMADMLTSSVIALLDYACENGGEHIKTFIADNGVECYKTREAELSKCLKYLKEVNENENSNNTSTKRPSIGLSDSQCETLGEFEQCALNELKKCNKSSILDIAKSLMHISFKATLCENLLSDASPTTAINFLLLTLTTAMLL